MRYLIFLAISLQATFALADAVEIQGTNLAEKRIRWTWQNLSTVLFSCSRDVNCSEAKYAPIIKSLLALLPSNSDFDVQAWQSQLVFKRESEFKFESDKGETHRIAMTGLNKGSVIYFNLDRIEQASSVPYDYDFYLGILVHELVHHLGQSDDTQRLPDQVGAYVATYFKNKFLASAQDFVPKQNLSFNVFNAEGRMNWSMASFELGDSLYDILLNQSEITYPCSAAMDVVTQQKMERPRWRISQLSIKRKSLTLESVAFVENTCMGMFGGSKDPYNKSVLWRAEVQFTYGPEMNDENWDQLTPTLVKSESQIGAIDNVDIIRAEKSSLYTLKSTVPSTKIAQPLDILKYEFEFKDDLKINFDGCVGQITSEDWAWLSSGSMPRMITATTCQVIPLDTDRRKVILTYQVPKSVVSLSLQLYNVTLYAKDKFFLAYPSRPFLNSIRGNVEKGLNPLKVTFKNLQPLERIGEQSLIDSYVTGSTDQFEILIERAATENVLRADFEVTLAVALRDGSLGGSPYSGPLGVDKILLKNLTKAVDNGNLKIQLNYQIPKMIGVLGCYGLKFEALSVLTPELELVSASYPQRYEAFVFSPRILPK